MVTEGELVLESVVQRPPETFFHTLMPDEGDCHVSEISKLCEGLAKRPTKYFALIKLNFQQNYFQ